jgi:hypothetical protein
MSPLEAIGVIPNVRILTDLWAGDRHPGRRSGVQILDSGSCSGRLSGPGRNDEREADDATPIGMGATAGLTSSVFWSCTAGQASSGTHAPVRRGS